MIGDRQVRNRGTLGGSIANNDPAADYPAAVLGLGATVITDKRKIAADDFFKGVFETALERDELITAVVVPRAEEGRLHEVPQSRVAIRRGRRVRRADGGGRARGGDGRGRRSGVFRVKAMEDALAKSWSPDALKAHRGAGLASSSPTSTRAPSTGRTSSR